MMIMVWEKSVALLIGALLYVIWKALDYIARQDKEEAAQ